jgi:quercetin dioxygenase-like cupin family protein
MPSIERPLAANALHFRLGEEHRADCIDAELIGRAGRSARTLIKNGPLRVTLVALAAGGGLAPHRADGPITLHALSGEVRVRAGAEQWLLGPGDLLSLGRGVAHDVDSRQGGVFLLTVVTQSQP